MAKNPWADDPDLQAMRASMRPERGPVPWRGLLFGVVLVACGTFAFAYYVPLYRAHQTLVASHGRVMSQIETLQASLTRVRADLESETKKREALEAEKKQREDAVKADEKELETVKQALEKGLDKPLSKKQAAVGIDDGRLIVGFGSSALFSAGKLDVSSSGKDALCDLAKAAGSRRLRVVGATDDDGLPALIKLKYDNAWQASATAAASVAETLESKCSVQGTRLTAAGLADTRKPSAALGDAKLGGLRVEIEIQPAK